MFLEQFKPWNTGSGFCFGLGSKSRNDENTKHDGSGMNSEYTDTSAPPPPHVFKHPNTPVPSRRVAVKSSSLNGFNVMTSQMNDVTSFVPLSVHGSSRKMCALRAQYSSAHISFIRLVEKIALREKCPEMTCNYITTHSETNMIMQTGNQIVEWNEFRRLGPRGVFICLIYLYYALNLFEQTREFMVVQDLQTLFKHDKKYMLATSLIMLLSSGDMIKNGVNISSQIRRQFMGIM
jgi:hypothetical protein